MKKFIVMNIDIQGKKREGEPPRVPKRYEVALQGCSSRTKGMGRVQGYT